MLYHFLKLSVSSLSLQWLVEHDLDQHFERPVGF